MNVESHENQMTNEFGFPHKILGEKLQSFALSLRDEFIYGGHWLALGASFLVLSTMLFLQIAIRWEFLIIAYLSGMLIYGYDRFHDIHMDASGNSVRSAYLQRQSHRLPFLLMGYGVLFFALLWFFGTIESVLFGAGLLCIGVLYTHLMKDLTKKIVGFKTYYTSFFVAALVIFTVLYCGAAFSWAVVFLFVFLFVRMFVDCCFCDIKDIVSDEEKGLLTFPVVLGKNRCLTMLVILNAVACAPVLFGVVFGLIPLFCVFLLFSTLVSFYFIQKARQPQTNIQSLISYVADGEYVVWPLLLCIGGLIL